MRLGKLHEISLGPSASNHRPKTASIAPILELVLDVVHATNLANSRWGVCGSRTPDIADT